MPGASIAPPRHPSRQVSADATRYTRSAAWFTFELLQPFLDLDELSTQVFEVLAE